jgi:hypothetical protein
VVEYRTNQQEERGMWYLNIGRIDTLYWGHFRIDWFLGTWIVAITSLEIPGCKPPMSYAWVSWAIAWVAIALIFSYSLPNHLEEKNKEVEQWRKRGWLKYLLLLDDEVNRGGKERVGMWVVGKYFLREPHSDPDRIGENKKRVECFIARAIKDKYLKIEGKITDCNPLVWFTQKGRVVVKRERERLERQTDPDVREIKSFLIKQNQEREIENVLSQLLNMETSFERAEEFYTWIKNNLGLDMGVAKIEQLLIKYNFEGKVSYEDGKVKYPKGVLDSRGKGVVK